MREGRNDSPGGETGRQIVGHDAQPACQPFKPADGPRLRNIQETKQSERKDEGGKGEGSESARYPLTGEFVDNARGGIRLFFFTRVKPARPCARSPGRKPCHENEKMPAPPDDRPGKNERRSACNRPGRNGRMPYPEERGKRLMKFHEGARRTVATACAAKPSPRPVKPMPSVVVALTLTRAVSICKISAIRLRMASR